MSDTVKSWIEERRKRRDVLGYQGLIFVPDEYGNATLWHDGRRVGSRDEAVLSLVDAHNTLPRALDALEQVLGLHVKGYETAGAHWCSECETKWPCATVQAIERAING